MAEKLTNRAKQALATKNKIYTCAVHLMNQHGYENITVEQIAKKANVSIGTFYHYFESKFDLLVETYRLGDLFFQENVPEILGRNGTCIQKVIDYFLLYAQLSLNEGIEKTCTLYVPSNKMFLTQGRAMQDLLNDILQCGQKNNEISKELSPDQITGKLFIAARGVIFDWCLHDGHSDLMAEMSDIINRLTDSYCTMKDFDSDTNP
jgi:TetR/AcrR family transcriptional regulator, fatty acid metabolism regulator protein